MSAENFYRLSPEELARLWRTGSDQEIADQFGVAKREVIKRRKELGISMVSLAAESALAELLGREFRFGNTGFRVHNPPAFPHTNSTLQDMETRECDRRNEDRMKATGIVRRIDDLGRVVIPKEIRRTLRVREGEPLEIFTDREGQIILKKYSPIGELGDFAKQYAEVLAQVSGATVGIADKDTLIAVSGQHRKELQDKEISKELEQRIHARLSVSAKSQEREYIPITQDREEKSFRWELIIPIISEGDAIGAVIFLGNGDKTLEEGDRMLATAAAGFLGRQMEG